jgi:hypothetical protein
MTDKLNELLLEIKGDRVIIPGGTDPDAELLVSKGFLFDLPAKKAAGGRSNCHRNSVAHYLFDQECRHRRRRLCTGYGLNEEVWRQHSWLCDDCFIYETTVKREAYWGVVLDGEHSARTIAGEVRSHLEPWLSKKWRVSA